MSNAYLLATKNSGGSPIMTLTGNDSIHVPPTGNNVNIIGINGVLVSGDIPSSTLTISFADTGLVGTVTTSDGLGQTRVLNVNIPVPTNEAISIRVNLVGYDSGNHVGIGGEVLATAKNNAGTVTFCGLPDETFNKDAALNAATFTAIVSGTNVQIQVIGVPTFIIFWKGIIDVVALP